MRHDCAVKPQHSPRHPTRRICKAGKNLDVRQTRFIISGRFFPPASHMTPFYVIGHKNPDTDAICSAIGYAALLRAVGEEPHAIAARCGEISQRTKWVLERAGLDAPLLITDVRVNAGLIAHRNVIKVNVADTFLTDYPHNQLNLYEL